MEFTYTYRDSTGAMKDGAVTAPSRSAAVAALRAKGVTPVRMSARGGGRAAGPAKAGRPGGAGARRILWMGGALAVAAIVCFILLQGTKEPAPVHPKQSSPVARPSVVHPPRTEGAQAVKATPPPKVRTDRRRPAAADGPEPRGGLAKVLSTTTNDAGFIVTAIVDANGETNLLTETVTPQTFTDPMLQIIAAAIGGAYENELAPLPPVGPEGDAQLRAALKVEIPDLESDTEEIRRLKDAVRSTREEMLKLLDSGISVNEMLTQHQQLWNENVQIRREMKAEYVRLLRSGDETAEDYLRKINEAFRSMGITEISEGEVKVKSRKARKGETE